jgi:hypothetical protein
MSGVRVRHPHSGYLFCSRRGDHERCEECIVRWDLEAVPRYLVERVIGRYYWNAEKHRVEYYDGGNQVKCEHRRRIGSCTKCGGGSALCECGKDSWTCEIHGLGKGRCVTHGKLKATCRECEEGRAFCHHVNKQGQPQRKSRCKECLGSELCRHLRNKNRCKECGGKEVCQHGQWYYTCPECPGPGACPHKGSKYNCGECGGSQICKHDSRIDACHLCLRYPQNFCQHCKQTYIVSGSHKTVRLMVDAQVVNLIGLTTC